MKRYQKFFQPAKQLIKHKSLILFLITGLFFFSCKESVQTSSFTFSGMGTVLNVIYTGEKKEGVEKMLKKDAEQIENDLSYYKKGSFVYLLNEKGASENVSVPHHVCELIDISLNYGKETDGVFDITYKSRGILWGEGRKPDEEQINKKKELTGQGLVKTDCTKNIVRFAKDGVKIDLGGIAKGYAIDRAGEILRNNGIENFIVNYGGDMLVCGKKGKKPWKVGIKDPEDSTGFFKTLDFGERSCSGVATSGDYERFFIIDGKKYSHIFDPRTGRPSIDAKSVTVVAKNALVADVAATAVSVAIHEEVLIKKIMEKFKVKIYTLSGPDMKWVEH